MINHFKKIYNKINKYHIHFNEGEIHMKKQLLLLVGILLPLISSCNVEPTVEPTV